MRGTIPSYSFRQFAGNIKCTQGLHTLQSHQPHIYLHDPSFISLSPLSKAPLYHCNHLFSPTSSLRHVQEHQLQTLTTIFALAQYARYSQSELICIVLRHNPKYISKRWWLSVPATSLTPPYTDLAQSTKGYCNVRVRCDPSQPLVDRSGVVNGLERCVRSVFIGELESRGADNSDNW